MGSFYKSNKSFSREDYEAWRKVAFLMAIGIFKNEQDAEDVIQDVTLKSLERDKNGKMENVREIEKYLTTMVLNEAKAILRKRKRDADFKKLFTYLSEMHTDPIDFEALINDLGLEPYIEEFKKEKPGREEKFRYLEDKYIRGMNYKEMAVKYNSTVNAITLATNRIRDDFRDFLDGNGFRD